MPALARRPHIGVAIPTFNRRTLVAATLQSVLHQDTDAANSIVVVDDGSTDGTFEALLDEFGGDIRHAHDEIAHREFSGDLRGAVHLIRQPNRHVAAARNTALRALLHLGCEHITHQDAGDLALPHKHRVLSDFLSSHDEVGLVHAKSRDMSAEGFLCEAGHGPFEIVYTRARPGGAFWERAARGALPRGELARVNYVQNQTTMYTAAALRAVGDDGWNPDGMRVGSDWAFYQRLEQAGVVFGFVPQYVAISRADGGGISAMRHYANTLDAVLEGARRSNDLFEKADLYGGARAGWPEAFAAWSASAGARDFIDVLQALRALRNQGMATGDYAAALVGTVRLDRLTTEDGGAAHIGALGVKIVEQLRAAATTPELAMQRFALSPSREHATALTDCLSASIPNLTRLARPAENIAAGQ